MTKHYKNETDSVFYAAPLVTYIPYLPQNYAAVISFCSRVPYGDIKASLKLTNWQ